MCHAFVFAKIYLEFFTAVWAHYHYFMLMHPMHVMMSHLMLMTWMMATVVMMLFALVMMFFSLVVMFFSIGFCAIYGQSSHHPDTE